MCKAAIAIIFVKLHRLRGIESGCLVILSALLLFGFTAAHAQAPCAGALGTARTLSVGSQGGLQIGLKSYPQTLVLQDRELVLTFDDGPLPGTTNLVLDALKAQCVKATFFLIGRNAEASPELVKRMIREGHTVGHHSYSHPSVTLRGLNEEAARSEIERGIAADEHAAYGPTSGATRVPFFRFPGFADTKPLLAWLVSRDFAVFGADLWASDWYPMAPQAQLDLLMTRVERAGRGIVLLHDTRGQTVAMLPGFLRALKERGYTIVHLVPGPGRSETLAAPQGWRSETKAALTRIMPRLLPRLPHPQGSGPLP